MFATSKNYPGRIMLVCQRSRGDKYLTSRAASCTCPCFGRPSGHSHLAISHSTPATKSQNLINRTTPKVQFQLSQQRPNPPTQTIPKDYSARFSTTTAMCVQMLEIWSFLNELDLARNPWTLKIVRRGLNTCKGVFSWWKKFGFWYCSKFRCYLTNNIQLYTN